jgi:hypothetical protein
MRLVAIVLMGCAVSAGCVLQPAEGGDTGQSSSGDLSTAIPQGTPLGGSPAATGLRKKARGAPTSGGQGQLLPPDPSSLGGSEPCLGPKCEPDPQPWGPPGWGTGK